MSFVGIIIGLLTVVFVIVSLLMVGVVLMQRSKQDGLGAAFGGDMAGSMFGSQTSNVLVKITVWLASLYFILTITLAFLYAHQNQGVTLPQVEQAEAETRHEEAEAIEKQPVPNPAGTVEGDAIAPPVSPTSPSTTAPAAEAPAPEAPATPAQPDTNAKTEAEGNAATD